MRGAGALLLALLGSASPAQANPASFDAALMASPTGERPAAAYFLVELLAERGQPEHAEHLRRELWRRQLGRLNGGPAAAPVTIGQAMAAGAALPALGEAFDADWQQAFNGALRLSWRGEGLQLTVSNTAPDALPMQGLRLRFGSDAAGLTLACEPDPPPPDAHAAERLGLGLAPEASLNLACAPPADARSQALLPVLLAAARNGGTPPRLLPRAVGEGPKRPERRLWTRWAGQDEPLRDWRRREQEARQPANAARQWQPGAALRPPELVPLPPTWRERIAKQASAHGNRLLHAWALAGLSLGLFGLGRLLLRHASLGSQTLFSGALAALGVLPVLASLHRELVAGGDGWAQWGRFGAVLVYAGLAGAVAVVASLMHRLHHLLDAEGLSWGQTIADGWRRALHIGGPTSAGQFWGFVAFAAWAWALLSPLGRPWNGITLLLLLGPLLTLGLRRLTSLSAAEFFLLLGGVAVFVAEHWL